jgi:alpha,alpha-trehalase
MLRVREYRLVILFLLLCPGLALAQSAVVPPSSGARQSVVTHSRQPDGQPLTDILSYISRGWERLTRSMTRCNTLKDVKSAGQPVLYLPADFSEPAAVKNLENNCGVSVRRLPASVEKPGVIDVNAIRPQGLLYVPNPYVVPGGRFNEMYGWDSYFIIRGLIRAGKVNLARGIVENFFFEIDHYGMVLNANRTYYLTRSQPPFLTSMIMAVYGAEKAAGHNDLAWLEKAYPFAVRDYDFWIRAPHLAGSTGLSRYYDFGNGPAPEVMAGNPAYYRYVASYFMSHPETGAAYLVPVRGDALSEKVTGPVFSIFLCQDAEAPSSQNCDMAERVGLAAKFYKGDRSMRESGFDVSFRFGPFGAGTPDYAPVGLNSLLYKTERDLEEMTLLLDRKQQAHEWQQRAAARRERMDKYLWNAKRGLFFDYDFVKRTQSTYEFATTFYPLWAGLASPDEAKAVAANLHLFLDPGGVVTSLRQTKAQWDYPYGWAPLQLIAAEGLRRYGFDQDADRIAYRFLGTVLRNFRRDGTIREKYNVVTRSSETEVRAGYRQNVIGFGWTNGVFLALWHSLPLSWRERLLAFPGTVACPRSSG